MCIEPIEVILVTHKIYELTRRCKFRHLMCIYIFYVFCLLNWNGTVNVFVRQYTIPSINVNVHSIYSQNEQTFYPTCCKYNYIYT